MKLKYVLSLLTSFLFLTSYSQPGLSWMKSIGSSASENEVVIDTYIDAAGNVYATGYYHGTVDFNPATATHFMTSKGGRDGFIIKYKPNGNFDWVRGFGGIDPDSTTTVFEEGTSIAIDNLGNVIVGGRFNDSCIVYTNTQTLANLSGAGQEDVLILKLTATGNYVWAKGFGGPSADRLSNVAVDKYNFIYAVGNFYDTIDLDPDTGVTSFTSIAGFLGLSSDIFYTKFNSTGNLVFGYRMGGNGDDYTKGLQVGSDNKVYLSGAFSNLFDANPAPQSSTLMQTNAYFLSGSTSSASDNDIFISKLDSAANLLWVRQIGGTNTHSANSLSLGTHNEVYVGGWSRAQSFIYNTNTIASAEDTLSFNAINDILLVKYDNNGNYKWGRSFGGPSSDVCYTTAADNQNNVYIGGSFYSFNIDMDPSSAVNKISLQNFAGTNQDAYIAKYDSLGNYVWSRSIGNTSVTSETVNTISVAPSGNEFVIGGLSNATNLDFDFSTLFTYFDAVGAWDGFTAKYTACSVDRSVLKDTTQLSVAPGYQSYQWINCNTNTIIAGATQNTYVPTANGSFACVITGSAGCTDTSSCILVDDVVDCSQFTIDTNVSVSMDTLSVSYLNNAIYQWYFCATNNPINSGGDSSKYNVVMNGSYKCKITLDNGCFAFTPCYDFNQLGVEEVLNSSDLNLYPQPAKGTINIALSNAQIEKVTIIDISGREILVSTPKNNIVELNINMLSAGIYSAKVISQTGKISVKKFTKILE